MTAPPLVLPHRNALLAALTVVVPTGEGVAPDPVPDAKRYAVLYMEPGQAVTESLANQRTDYVVGFQVTCIGPTVEHVLWVADRVRTALAAPLTVDGRVCWRAEELGGPPVARDDDVTPPLYYLPVQYRLRSIPA